MFKRHLYCLLIVKQIYMLHARLSGWLVFYLYISDVYIQPANQDRLNHLHLASEHHLTSICRLWKLCIDFMIKFTMEKNH